MLYEEALRRALRDLYKAVKKLYRNGKVEWVDQFGIFYFYDGILWPSRRGRLPGLFVDVGDAKYSIDNEDIREILIRKIIEFCDEDPAEILFVLRRIRAAVDWCMAVAEGKSE